MRAARQSACSATWTPEPSSADRKTKLAGSVAAWVRRRSSDLDAAPHRRRQAAADVRRRRSDEDEFARRDRAPVVDQPLLVERVLGGRRVDEGGVDLAVARPPRAPPGPARERAARRCPCRRRRHAGGFAPAPIRRGRGRHRGAAGRSARPASARARFGRRPSSPGQRRRRGGGSASAHYCGRGPRSPGRGGCRDRRSIGVRPRGYTDATPRSRAPPRPETPTHESRPARRRHPLRSGTPFALVSITRPRRDCPDSFASSLS